MPFYSVHISGGDDKDGAGRDMREMFNGTDADYTGCPNYFYVQRNYDLNKLRSNIDSALDGEYEVTVKKISREEFFWRRRGKS